MAAQFRPAVVPIQTAPLPPRNLLPPRNAGKITNRLRISRISLRLGIDLAEAAKSYLNPRDPRQPDHDNRRPTGARS
ncbi:hypothetical protein BJ970_007571 [Saccharopolyspora phatthalungensis]|uniref:Uncharacterized protein n=1 Tax=Saccharopolyspora phatthalungensis TaxID=664693 RepID=A0A840QIK1_9PSEU|nr:hypothetical protein [Saccharopolyspora phatthalungensis]